ncbi:MAG: cytochrome c3 family protein, partial [Armatimonadota bacterium]
MKHRLAVLGFIVLVVLRSAPVAAAPADAKAPLGTSRGTGQCLVCHSNSEFGVVGAGGQWRPLFVSPEQYAASVHGSQDCTACHRNMANGVHLQPGIGDAETEAAVEALKGVSADDPVATAACIICHPGEFAEYRDSIHGRTALAEGEDAPSCTDCHGYHYIKRVENLESSVYPSNVPATCAQCHADSTVMARHDIDRNV